MDNILDDDLSCFRIRSVRRRKRAQREDYDKMLLRFKREEDALYRNIESLGWTELKPPIQRGFKRFFVLRPDLSRAKGAEFFEGILKKINTTQFSSERNFKRKRKRFGKKVYTVREQFLRDIELHEFERKFSEKEKFYFYPTLTHSRQSKKPFVVYRFVEPWRFVLRVQPDMITKVRIKDLDLERERDRIRNFLDVIPRRERLAKLLMGGTYHWGYPPPRERANPLHNRGFHDILDEYLPDKTMTISIRNPRDNEGFIFLSIADLEQHIVAFAPLYDGNTPSTKNLFRRTFCKENYYDI